MLEWIGMMGLRDLEERFRVGVPLLEELRANQLDRLREMAPGYQLETLKDWVDLARAERAVKGRYRGRYLFELIQNANDALLACDEGRPGGVAQGRVRLELSAHSLIVANQGQPFEEDNLRALCRLHNTTKRASKQIGHKGIGFKSVLEISATPEIYSGPYALYFDGERLRQDVQAIMGDRWSNEPLSTLRTPYPRDLSSLPVEDRARVEALFQEGYVTVVRLPLAEEGVVARVEQRLREDIQPTLLLFMTAISQIEMRFPCGEEIRFQRESRPCGHPERNEVLLHRRAGGEERVDSRWLVLGPYRERLDDPSLLDDLEESARESWLEVRALGFGLAFPLDEQGIALDDARSSFPFHVYFPTEEPSGLPFIVHADFHVGDDRKTLDNNALNQWLAEHVAYYIASHGVEHLQARWPRDATPITILTPTSRPERDFARAFMAYYLHSLRESAFVPVEGDEYRTPDSVCLPPREVEFKRFTALFPAASLASGTPCSYPLPAVAHAGHARDFLAELGARSINAEQVVESLLQGRMPPVDEAYPLLAFLAGWWEALPAQHRAEFLDLLRQLPVLPTAEGWRRPGTQMVFQANLRPNSPEVTAPPGLEFAVIRRDIYPDSGTGSAQYQLFDALGANNYALRDIVGRAILPILTDHDAFTILVESHPHSLYEAYRLLRQFFEEERSAVRFEERLARVPVRATNSRHGRWQGWKAASECYFGAGWPGGERLEELYREFHDAFFMLPLPPELIASEEERERWMLFFEWLGVRSAPALLTHAGRSNSPHYPPVGAEYLWKEYIAAHEPLLSCPTYPQDHGRARKPALAHSLHHWAAIVARANQDQLLNLYSLVAENWTRLYQPAAHTELRCGDRVRCATARVDDLLLFQLNNSPWLPARVGDDWSEPLPPNRIWILGETDPADVRRLVPTFPLELRSGIFQALASELGFISPGSATVEDYLALLELIPERYPLEGIESWDESQRRGWQSSIQAVFNWAWEHIQTGLVSRGEEDEPELPGELKVLAERNGSFCYIDAGAPDLVYADDKRLARHWAGYCAFLPINDNWQRLRRWLGLQNLSELIVQEWEKGTLLDKSTAILGEIIAEVLPYYLVLVKLAQPANYARIAGRLQRLTVHVVSHLAVTERLQGGAGSDTQRRPATIHLERTPGPSHSGGQQAVAGELYLTEEVLDNLDLLGSYIAEYTGIAHLADAYVILLERDQDGRMRFLRSKGADSHLLEEVSGDLHRYTSIKVDQATELRSALLTDSLNRLRQDGREAPPASPLNGQARGSDELISDTLDVMPDPPGVEEAGAQITYPPLRLDLQPTVTILEPIATSAGPTDRQHGGGGGNGRGRAPRQEITEALGRRGEQWAYEAEKHRLRALGLDPAALEACGNLHWLAKSRPTASYDIQSVTLDNSGHMHPIYIEVKSTTGTGRDIFMSRSEFEFALAQGDRYWLYWVSHVETEMPDGPKCYPNFARMLGDGQIDLHVETLGMTLPAATPIHEDQQQKSHAA